MAKCNICSWSGNDFEPRFRTHGRLCVCPSCRSLDRNRHLYHILGGIDSSPDGTLAMLDIAPSAQLMKRFAADYLYAAIDVQGFADDVLPMNMNQLEFADNYFDRALCCHVLEHVRDDTGAMAEVFRTLTPGGVFICQVPYRDGTETRSLAVPDKHGHVWEYDGNDFVARLDGVGFNTQRVSFRVEFPDCGFDRLDTFVATKPGTPTKRDHTLLKWMNERYSREVGKDFARKPISTGGP